MMSPVYALPLAKVFGFSVVRRHSQITDKGVSQASAIPDPAR
jgi:hypothetical protein